MQYDDCKVWAGHLNHFPMEVLAPRLLILPVKLWTNEEEIFSVEVRLKVLCHEISEISMNVDMIALGMTWLRSERILWISTFQPHRENNQTIIHVFLIYYSQ